MLRENKGQALVEFVLILPFLLLIIMAIIDFGSIILKRYSLANSMDLISQMYIENNNMEINSYVDKHNINIKYIEEDDYVTIKLAQKINVVTPVLNVLYQDYQIEASKTIYVGTMDDSGEEHE